MIKAYRLSPVSFFVSKTVMRKKCKKSNQKPKNIRIGKKKESLEEILIPKPYNMIKYNH